MEVVNSENSHQHKDCRWSFVLAADSVVLFLIRIKDSLSVALLFVSGSALRFGFVKEIARRRVHVVGSRTIVKSIQICI